MAFDIPTLSLFWAWLGRFCHHWFHHLSLLHKSSSREISDLTSCASCIMFLLHIRSPCSFICHVLASSSYASPSFEDCVIIFTTFCHHILGPVFVLWFGSNFCFVIWICDWLTGFCFYLIFDSCDFCLWVFGLIAISQWPSCVNHFHGLFFTTQRLPRSFLQLPLFKYFAQALKNTCIIPLSQLPKLYIKESTLDIKILEDGYQLGLASCKDIFNGRVIMSKGDTLITSSVVR